LDGNGTLAEAVLIVSDERQRQERHALCRVDSIRRIPRPTPAIHLLVAPPRGKNMDTVLKTATELGVETITPILCQFAVSKPDVDGKATWEQTLIAACKQSGNPWLPTIQPPCPFHDALGATPKRGFFGAVPQSWSPSSETSSPFGDEPLALWIGPEGGFSQAEEQLLMAQHVTPISIGPWILRVETAVPALLGAIHSLAKRSNAL
jgi:16S rRNA (uracil1498-N3)-methyltransferase